VHLVGFTMEIYYNARTYKRQIYIFIVFYPIISHCIFFTSKHVMTPVKSSGKIHL